MKIFSFIALLLILVGCQKKEQSSARANPSGNSTPVPPALPAYTISSWIKHFGATTKVTNGVNTADDSCNSVTTDSSGNIYCAGMTKGSLGGEPNGGGLDAVIIKLDKDGEIVWTVQLGSTTRAPSGDNSADQECFSVAVDSSGNVYCGGYSRGAFGGAYGGERDAFILKLSATGELKWVKQFGTSGDEVCYGISLDKTGNVYCGGNTSGDLKETHQGWSDIFMTRFDPDGNQLWLTHFGATTKFLSNSGDDNCYGLKVDDNGNAYCVGQTSSNFSEVAQGWNALVVKVSSTGVPVWARHFGTATKTEFNLNIGSERFSTVDVDLEGNVIASGYTSGSFADVAGGGQDILVVKLDSAGIPQWIKQIGTNNAPAGGDVTGWESGKALATDKSGNIYVTGSTGMTLGEEKGGASGGDIFILKLDPDGHFDYLKQFGAITKFSSGSNSGSDSCLGIAIDRDGSIVCGGWTQGNFGEIKASYQDAFIFKIRADWAGL